MVTSDRVIFRHGMFAKTGIEIPLERVNNVNFNQGILERMLGAGDLLIESGGESGQQRFTDIRHPDRVTNTIHAEMEANEDRTYGGRAGRRRRRRSTSPAAREARGMLQRGTLTPEEFEAQKRKLLGLSRCRRVAGSSASSRRSPRRCSRWGADVVACTRFCEQPDLPHVGGTKDPDIAAIVELGARPRGGRRRGEPPRGRRGAAPRPGSRCTSPRVAVGRRRASPRSPTLAAGRGRPAPDARRAAAGRRRRGAAFVPIWRRPWMTINADTYGSSVLRAPRRRATSSPTRPTATRRSSSPTSPRCAPDLVLVPTEPYPFTDAPRRRAARRVPGAAVDWSTARTCSGGAPARRARIDARSDRQLPAPR